MFFNIRRRLAVRPMCAILMLLSTVILFYYLWFHWSTPQKQSTRSRPSPIQWANTTWSTTIDTCQQTLFRPFRVGCPSSCRRAIDDNETMYRMGVTWYFGQRILFEEDKLPIAYDKGINYQSCNRPFVENFISSSNRFEEELRQSLPKNVDMKIKQQTRMHMALVYFCCLRENETDWIREIMHEWVNDHRPFDFTVRFNKLECWHERHNSVTNILVGDEETQQTVMALVHDLYDRVYHAGFPMEIHREEQMPIHVTLVGAHLGNGEGKLYHRPGDEEDIQPYLPHIHKIISRISKDYGTNWTGTGDDGSNYGNGDGIRMHVTHDPRYSQKGAWHAGLKPRDETGLGFFSRYSGASEQQTYWGQRFCPL